jgi:Fe-S cluster biosynthesis and repair protein YggX
MNQSKEILEILTKTQIKQMEIFLETIQKIAEAWGKEGFVEVFSEAYKHWVEQQTELMKEVNTQMQKHAGINMPNHLLDLQKMQTKWEEYLKSNKLSLENFNPNNLEQINEIWAKLYGAWFEPFVRPFKEFSASGVGGYNMMVETVKDYLKAFTGNKRK